VRSFNEEQGMKIQKAIVLAALGALVAWGTGAQDESIKIGVVDIELAISSTEDGKKAREELMRKEREAQQQIKPLMDRYQGLEEELKAKKFVLSEEALYQKQLDLAEMRNLIQNKYKELEGQFQVDQKRLEGPLTVKLGEIISEVGKSQGYTLIIRRNAPGVLYTREALDLTDVIIQRYNQKG
jgi:outer membrane protein